LKPSAMIEALTPKTVIRVYFHASCIALGHSGLIQGHRYSAGSKDNGQMIFAYCVKLTVLCLTKRHDQKKLIVPVLEPNPFGRDSRLQFLDRGYPKGSRYRGSIRVLGPAYNFGWISAYNFNPTVSASIICHWIHRNFRFESNSKKRFSGNKICISSG
jgi:hypothetical protein